MRSVSGLSTSNLPEGVFPLFQSLEELVQDCYFFLKCLAKFTGETILAGRFFVFCLECGKFPYDLLV